jgi:transposase
MYYDHTYWYKRRQKAVCCSLLSSTSSMGRSGELSGFERGLVIGWHISKKSTRDIATVLKLPRSMAGDMIVKWKHEGTTTMKPQPGRPRLMTNRGRWVLKKVVRETRQTISETITCELHTASNGPASTLAVCLELRGMGSNWWAAAHKQNISPVNAKYHLKWCKEQWHWTLDNWKHVIWGDESSYIMWWSDGRVWMWWIPVERYLPACVMPTVKFGGHGITVWGCLSWNGPGSLVILHGYLNTEG